jgi:AcrR family transcriptional regulator
MAEGGERWGQRAPEGQGDAGRDPLATGTDGRASRWNDHNERRRDLILAVAVETIRQTGDVGNVADIAAGAGMPRSVVYRLFRDRDDLDEQLRGRIIEDLMSSLAPTLTPRGPINEAIGRAVDAYVSWIVDNPRLHQYLGIGSARRRKVGSRVVTSTRTAIAVQVTRVIDTILIKQGAGDSAMAEPLAFGLVGLVDTSVNRWLSRSLRPLTPQQFSQFLQVSIWQVIDGNLRRAGVELDPGMQVSGVI